MSFFFFWLEIAERVFRKEKLNNYCGKNRLFFFRFILFCDTLTESIIEQQSFFFYLYISFYLRGRKIAI